MSLQHPRMDEIVMNALRIPVRIEFEEGLGTDIQARIVEMMARLTPFCVLRQDVSISTVMSNLAGDMDSSLDMLVAILSLHDFGQGFKFMDGIDVLVCAERVSNDVSGYCVLIDEVSEDRGVVNAFGRILDQEIERRVTRHEKWDIKSFTSLFRSNSATDKKIADGLFVSRKYREAYKIYSRYGGADEFSCYCTEMSVYCLLLSKRPVSREAVECMKNPGSMCNVYLIRLITTVMSLGLRVLALRLSSLLPSNSLFEALAFESLSRSLCDEDGYFRKRVEMAFSSAMIFNSAGFCARFARCAEHFLKLLETRLVKNMTCSTRRDILFLDYPIRRIMDALVEMKIGAVVPVLMDEIGSHGTDEPIRIFRRRGGSIVELQGSMNVRECISMQCKAKGSVRILDAETSTIQIYDATKEICIGGPGRFLIKDLTVSKGGMEHISEINRTVEVGKDVPFMHIDVSSDHEVYCGENYTFVCRVDRNYSSSTRVVFGSNEFVTDSDVFDISTMFPITGVFCTELSVESNGIESHQKISFVVLPSFSIDMFHYKYCFPLVFLKIHNHTAEDARVTSLCMLNREFEMSGMDEVRSVYSYKESSVRYFRENVVGVNNLFEIRCRKCGNEAKKHQEVLASMEKSVPIVSDLFFEGLVAQTAGQVLLPRGRTCFVRLFLRRREEFAGSTLSLIRTDSDPQLTCTDMRLIRDSRFDFVLDNIESFPGLSFDTTLPHECPVKIEIELSSGRTCGFAVNGLFNMIALASTEITSSVVHEHTFRSLMPFIYITHSTSIELNEPAIMYLCVSNYYERYGLVIKLSSHSIVMCDEDRVLDVQRFSFSLFEIRSIFLKKKKYGTEDLRIQVIFDGQEINYEGLVDLPFVA